MRRAGILVPLSPFPRRTAGASAKLATFPCWRCGCAPPACGSCSCSPINEMPPGERSPYSALSAMAIDPQFISLRQLEDFDALGGEAQLEPELRERLAGARAARAVDYATARELKQTALRRSFARFKDVEWHAGTSRAAALREVPSKMKPVGSRSTLFSRPSCPP